MVYLIFLINILIQKIIDSACDRRDDDTVVKPVIPNVDAATTLRVV